jgi:hypothetical protein
MLVFDESAMVALLAAYKPIYGIWDSADRGHVVVAFPAAALHDASREAEAGRTAWDPLLWSATVHVLPLGESAAKQIGCWAGSLAENT